MPHLTLANVDVFEASTALISGCAILFSLFAYLTEQRIVEHVRAIGRIELLPMAIRKARRQIIFGVASLMPFLGALYGMGYGIGEQQSRSRGVVILAIAVVLLLRAVSEHYDRRMGMSKPPPKVERRRQP